VYNNYLIKTNILYFQDKISICRLLYHYLEGTG